MDWQSVFLAARQAGGPTVLVTVVAVEGSAPRGPGSKMLVMPKGIAGSIGGGELEYRAIRQARDLMADDVASPRLDRVSLGPQLGQCCGGVAELLYEPLSDSDAAWLDKAVALGPEDTALRVVMVDAEAGGKWLIGPGGVEPDDLPAPFEQRLQDLLAGKGATSVIELADDSHLIADALAERRQPLFLFGAGHVGQAIVAALAGLPFRVTWVDSRADAFPADTPENVAIDIAEPPRFAVARAPAEAFYLVMTHSHDLDLEVCEAVLRRGDSGYLGLIGSATKRARFLKRLAAKGLPDECLAQLTCPIGLPGIAGKEPAVIAAAVAADLLYRNEEAPTGGKNE